MTPKGLMILGAIMFVFASIFAVIGASPSTLICAFMGGMMLGKGYGIWEERERLRTPK